VAKREETSELDDIEALNYAYYTSIMAEIEKEFKQKVQDGYKTDRKYAKVIKFIEVCTENQYKEI